MPKPKRNQEENLKRWYKKLKRLERKIKGYSTITLTTEDTGSQGETQDGEYYEEGGGTLLTPVVDAEMSGSEQQDFIPEPEPIPGTSAGIEASSEQPTISETPENIEVIDPELLLILGDPAPEAKKFGPNISDNLSSRWTPILKQGKLQQPTSVPIPVPTTLPNNITGDSARWVQETTAATPTTSTSSSLITTQKGPPCTELEGCRLCAMAQCSFARCQQERRAIRKELQSWAKNMVSILGLERVAEELMGRRKWKLYQDAILPKREGEQSSDDSMPSTDPPPALKIKTIEQINEDKPEERRETILESLIKRPATVPKVEMVEEPTDWKPSEKCYFCVDGETAERTGAASPASESDSSSVSGPALCKSPAAAPPLLQHLLQLQLQAQSPQAIAQLQQMIATLAALGTGLVPPALSQAWLMQRLSHARMPDRLQDVEKVPAPGASPTSAEQPLDLSAKSTSSTSGTPPPDAKDTARLKRAMVEGAGAGNSTARRTYTEDELQSALRDIQSGRLGTRRAAVVYGIPRSTLRNKVNKFGLTAEPPDSDPDSDPERPDSPPSVILKIPTFPPPDDKSPSPATPATAVAPVTPHLPQPQLTQPSLLLPATVFADPPSTQHLFTSLSDVIAKSISQKFQQPLDRPHQQAELAFMRHQQDRHVSVIKTPPDNSRNYSAPSNSRASMNNNGQPATGKGTRPKRGKYRNYDRDSLVEAVKAVQRGEMSVHRAGSYYGVPHSTLEYKVKERHLMRPRKREPKPQQDIKPQPPKPPPPKPMSKPFTNGMNGPETPGYPPSYFWAGAGFPAPPAPDLYASHMMRRLREEAPPPANGSFLEGIIRSSLERPGAALLQRLSGEARAPADAPSLLRRLTGEDEGPPARRARVDSSDRALAAEMREAVQRLRADKLRPRNGTPTPPPAPPAAPPDRA